MPTTMSEVIPVADPAGTGVSVICHPERGQAILALQVGARLSTLKFDAAGWRALHAALGFPPPVEFVPNVRTCRACGQTDETRKQWVAANLCACCLRAPFTKGRP
jgi:hypothetical protein